MPDNLYELIQTQQKFTKSLLSNIEILIKTGGLINDNYKTNEDNAQKKDNAQKIRNTIENIEKILFEENYEQKVAEDYKPKGINSSEDISNIIFLIGVVIYDLSILTGVIYDLFNIEKQYLLKNLHTDHKTINQKEQNIFNDAINNLNATINKICKDKKASSPDKESSNEILKNIESIRDSLLKDSKYENTANQELASQAFTALSVELLNNIESIRDSLLEYENTASQELASQELASQELASQKLASQAFTARSVELLNNIESIRESLLKDIEYVNTASQELASQELASQKLASQKLASQAFTVLAVELLNYCSAQII